MPINVVDLGKMNYREALQIQERLLARRQANEIGDTLLLVEHPATLTLGTRGQFSNILASEEMLAKNGIEIFEVNRGGDVTYHGPGQLVGYPIMNLDCVDNDIRQFIWSLEETFIRLLKSEYGIDATREDKKYTGVWVASSQASGNAPGNAPSSASSNTPGNTPGQSADAWSDTPGNAPGNTPGQGSEETSHAPGGKVIEKKITAIGIAVKRRVTMHGFAFNVNTNLEHFNLINPCGITDKGVTSLQELTGEVQNFEDLKTKVTEYFCDVFNRQICMAKIEDLL